MPELNRLHAQPLKVKPGKPRVCIISAWNEKYAPLAEIAIPNFVAYGAKHGYAVRGFPGEYHEDPSRPETFGDKAKFQFYHDVRGHCDIVCWLDIDSLFMNHDTCIEDKIGFMPGQIGPGFSYFNSFWYTYDENGPLSGLWIARTDGKTEHDLRYCYEHAAIENNVRHGKIEPNGISDQDMMTRLMNVPPFSRTFGDTCFPAKPSGHCYPENYEDGDWIVTFPGRPIEERLNLMKEYAARVR
jgi:hypothetical protein